jgi:cytochrome b561
MTRSSPDGTRERYDGLTIALHWIVVILVAGLWVGGQTTDWLPKGLLRGAIWSTHVVTGFALTGIVLVRLVWRLTAGRHLPEVGSTATRWAAKLVQTGLFTLLVGVVALGLANAFNRGFNLYGVVKLPKIGDPSLKETLTDLHGLIANILLALASFHAAAALAHYYFWKDNVLARMKPGSWRA